MTVRQRWTFLYPLLILAVCLGIKGELADKRLARQMDPASGRLSVAEVRTHRIVVTTHDKKPCVEMGPTADDSGLVLVYGPKSQTEPLVRIRVDHAGDHGVVDIRDAQGRLVTTLTGTDDGGVIQVNGKPDQRALWLGHQGELRMSGMLALEPDGGITYLRQGPKLLLWGLHLPWHKERPEPDSGEGPTPPNPTDLKVEPAEPKPASSESADEPHP